MLFLRCVGLLGCSLQILSFLVRDLNVVKLFCEIKFNSVKDLGFPGIDKVFVKNASCGLLHGT